MHFCETNSQSDLPPVETDGSFLLLTSWAQELAFGVLSEWGKQKTETDKWKGVKGEKTDLEKGPNSLIYSSVTPLIWVGFFQIYTSVTERKIRPIDLNAYS